MMKDMLRSHWPIGRALKTYGGSNDVVRPSKLNATTGEMIRPASKINLLETKLH